MWSKYLEHLPLEKWSLPQNMFCFVLNISTRFRRGMRPETGELKIFCKSESPRFSGLRKEIWQAFKDWNIARTLPNERRGTEVDWTQKQSSSILVWFEISSLPYLPIGKRESPLWQEKKKKTFWRLCGSLKNNKTCKKAS